MHKLLLFKALFAAAFPLFATDDETASAASSAADTQPAPTESNADADANAGSTTSEAPAVAGADQSAPAAGDSSQAEGNATLADVADGAAPAAAPVEQTPTPVAQPGDASDPVLETVKTPAHNVAEEIREQIKKLEELPAEVAAWFESKFVELAAHIKALL